MVTCALSRTGPGSWERLLALILDGFRAVEAPHRLPD
jgi:hypothetical protein